MPRDDESLPEGIGDEAEADARDVADPGPGIPRWRQIEIMHERAQLRKMLDDFDMDFDQLEAEVFGSEAEHDAFYRHLGDDSDDEIEIESDEEDEYEDEDYEDIED